MELKLIDKTKKSPSTLDLKAVSLFRSELSPDDISSKLRVPVQKIRIILCNNISKEERKKITASRRIKERHNKVQSMLAELEQGATLQSLAEKRNISKQAVDHFISRWFTEEQLEVYRKAPKSRAVSKLERYRIPVLELANKGMSMSEVRKKLGISQAKLTKISSHYGYGEIFKNNFKKRLSGRSRKYDYEMIAELYKTHSLEELAKIVGSTKSSLCVMTHRLRQMGIIDYKKKRGHSRI